MVSMYPWLKGHGSIEAIDSRAGVEDMAGIHG